MKAGRKPIAAAGKQVGMMTVLEQVKGNTTKCSFWRCVCTLCGKESVVSSRHLRKTSRKSCVHCKMEHRKFPKIQCACVICGDPVEKNSNQPNGSTCSPECFEQHRKNKWSTLRYKDMGMFLHMLQNQIKCRAKRKGQPFDLPPNHLYGLYLSQDKRCSRTGVEFDLSTAISGGKAAPNIPSADRVDSSKGYTVDNVELTIYAFNIAKNSWSHKEFTEMCMKYLTKQGIICIPKEGWGQ